jgi:hypothetical protein
MMMGEVFEHVMQKFRVRKFWHFASIIFHISRIAGAGVEVEIDLKIRISANSRQACLHFPPRKRPQFLQTLWTFLYFFSEVMLIYSVLCGTQHFLVCLQGPNPEFQLFPKVATSV